MSIYPLSRKWRPADVGLSSIHCRSSECFQSPPCQERGDVAGDGLRHHIRELGGEPLHELARAAPPGVGIRALDVAANVLHIVPAQVEIESKV